MTEKEEKGGHGYRQPSLVWPVILITAGVLFLLSNLGVLEVDFWNLWRLWPVLLILAGLEIIVGRRSVLGNVIGLVLTLVIIGGLVLLMVVSPERLGLERRSGGPMRLEEPISGAEQVNLVVDFAAGELALRALDDSPSLIVCELDLATERQPQWEVGRDSDEVKLKLGYGSGSFSSWGRGDTWELQMSPKVQLDLDVTVGAGEADLDLTGLDVRQLTVKTGAGRSVIILPREGIVNAQVTGGVGQLTIEIPARMAAQVRLSRGLSGVDIGGRLERQSEGLYQTADWGHNDNSVDLRIELGVGMVTVRDR